MKTMTAAARATAITTSTIMPQRSRLRGIRSIWRWGGSRLSSILRLSLIVQDAQHRHALSGGDAMARHSLDRHPAPEQAAHHRKTCRPALHRVGLPYEMYALTPCHRLVIAGCQTSRILPLPVRCLPELSCRNGMCTILLKPH